MKCSYLCLGFELFLQLCNTSPLPTNVSICCCWSRRSYLSILRLGWMLQSGFYITIGNFSCTACSVRYLTACQIAGFVRLIWRFLRKSQLSHPFIVRKLCSLLKTFHLFGREVENQNNFVSFSIRANEKYPSVRRRKSSLLQNAFIIWLHFQLLTVQ